MQKDTKATVKVNEETQMLNLMNKHRTKQRLQKLTMNTEAANLASNLANVISSGFLSGSANDGYLASMNTQWVTLTQTHGVGKKAKVVLKTQLKVASEKARILNSANTGVGISITDAGNKQKLFVMVFVKSSIEEKPPTTENPLGKSIQHHLKIQRFMFLNPKEVDTLMPISWEKWNRITLFFIGGQIKILK